MELTGRFYLLRNSINDSEQKIVLQSNNRVELQFIKDVLEMELPPEVWKNIRYSVEENVNFSKTLIPK